PIDGANGLKSFFSTVAHTKTNAPNKSGRLLGLPSVRFHTVCFGSLFLCAAENSSDCLPIGFIFSF
ncbi:hypothetical protein, partial [Pseudomonas syringae]|uniref:hypothetical protein n=1 Tax=Pseudomonas syringae TaxID=317 RepID=UPI00320462F0